jgi:uncharacterized OsmC-like protein
MGETRLINTRSIVVSAEASSIEKWRKQVIAGQPETGKFFAFISDEGSYMPGGEGTAPTPLTYFVSGMALWLLSHVSQVAAKRKIKISNEKVKVLGYFHESGSVLKGDAAGFCDEFEVQVFIDSGETAEVISDMVKIARRMCFTENALLASVRVKVSQTVNGRMFEGWTPCRITQGAL